MLSFKCPIFPLHPEALALYLSGDIDVGGSLEWRRNLVDNGIAAFLRPRNQTVHYVRNRCKICRTPFRKWLHMCGIIAPGPKRCIRQPGPFRSDL